MIRRFPLLAAALLPLAAHAQTKPGFTGPSGLPAVAGDPISLSQVVTAFEAKADAGRLGVSPDALRLPADGADDAPAIQRAIAAACGSPVPVIAFQARHYRINSPVTQSCFVHWIGQGWQEQNANAATAPGTWFDIGPAFIGAAGSPITLSGAPGSVLEGFGFTEPGQPPAPVPVTANGQVTGWSPPTWTPAAYVPVLTVADSPGVTVRDVMLLGVNAGILCIRSGRCDFHNVRGQVFAYAVNLQQDYDVGRIVDLHVWPYWSQADPVIAWTQAQTSAIISMRNDTPMWDRVFVFGAKDGVLLAGQPDGPTRYTPGGTTTGLAAGTLSCDFVQTCLRVDATAAGATLQINNLRSYGQAWNTVAGAPVAMLPGSSVLNLGAATTAQVGQVEAFGSDTAVVRFTGTAGTTTLHMGSLFTHPNWMSANAVQFAFPAGGTTAAYLGANVVAPGTPAGFALTNLRSGGVGTLSMPTTAPVQ